MGTNLNGIILSFIMGATLVACSSAPKGTEPKELTNSDRARKYVEIANGSLVEGDPIGALQTLAQAEALDKNLPELYHSKALAYYTKHDLEAALIAANKALEMVPDYSDANNTIGKIYLDTGNKEEARKHLLLAAKDALYRDSFKAWTNLGILEYRSGNLPDAEKFFDHAILDASDKACIAYYYRGHIRSKKSNFDGAIADYRRATQKFCTRFADAQFALGLAYQKSKQYDLARKTYLAIQTQYPNTKLAEQAFKRLQKLP